MIPKTVIFVEIHALMEFSLEKNRTKMIEQNLVVPVSGCQ